MRAPIVAGKFYERTEQNLRKQIENCFKHKLGPGTIPEADISQTRNIKGLISPHAGYVYSGPVAAHGFFALASEVKPEVIILVGPNHQGIGADVSLSKQDQWVTPLGTVDAANDVGGEIISLCSRTEWDDSGHTWEHSLEVQIPFLQYIFGEGLRVVFISMLLQDLSTSIALGEAIASTLRDRDGVVIASSDFSHYESRSSASRKDGLALDAIMEMDVNKLRSVVDQEGITMCGCGPVIAMLTACRIAGAGKTKVLKYATSGDITSDYSHVVGYASVEVALQ